MTFHNRETAICCWDESLWNQVIFQFFACTTYCTLVSSSICQAYIMYIVHILPLIYMLCIPAYTPYPGLGEALFKRKIAVGTHSKAYSNKCFHLTFASNSNDLDVYFTQLSSGSYQMVPALAPFQPPNLGLFIWAWLAMLARLPGPQAQSCVHIMRNFSPVTKM